MIKMEFNLRESVEEYHIERDIRESQYHDHLKGEIGASSLWNCNKIGAMNFSNAKRKKNTGSKGKKGAMWQGTNIHEMIQSIHENYYFEGLNYASEVYVSVPLLIKKIDGFDLKIFSPIDEALISSNEKYESVEIISHKFKNTNKEVKVLAEGAEFKQIFDIKSAGDYAFKKHKINMPVNYIAQMQAYLYGSGLEFMDVHFYAKSNLDSYSVRVYKDPVFWNEIKEKKKRQLILSKKMKFEKNDLDFFASDNASFICKYCSESDTYDETDEYGNTKLIFVKPCKDACKFVKEHVNSKFTYGTKWKRGRSHIQILHRMSDDKLDGYNSDEIIVSKNKSGRIFIDNIYYATINYKEIK